MTSAISPRRREQVLDALRRGTVPQDGLSALAVGLDRFQAAVGEDLDRVAAGGNAFKAIRGDYGCGKTFFSRWLQEQARTRKFATAEVQISESDTPLHRLETVYRRLTERITTAAVSSGAFRSIIDTWFYALEEDVLSSGQVKPDDAQGLVEATNALMEKRLDAISRNAPAFAAALRGYRIAQAQGDMATAEGLLAWVAGQPNVSASIKRAADIKGDVDHVAALSFLRGLLVVLRDSGHPGLLVVLDEVETLQRVRADVREKALNALRQLIDEIDAGRFPGLFLVITGTPAFFDGPQGMQKLPPLAQRLHTDFDTDSRFDNPRAAQIRLRAFDRASLVEVGKRVRDIFVSGSKDPSTVSERANDELVESLADAVTGELGGKVGIAPRLFLKKWVADLLDRIELYRDFDPRKDYRLTLRSDELTPQERNLTGASSVEDIPLDT
jgi:hypothetical protein